VKIANSAMFREKISNATKNVKNITQKILRIFNFAKNAKYVIQNNYKCITVNNADNVKLKTKIYHIV
jgi:hypothetical protein